MEIQKVIDLMNKLIDTTYSGDAFFENNLKIVQALDSSSDHSIEYPSQNIRFFYVTKTVELLFRLRDALLKHSDDTCYAILGVTQCNTASTCLDYAVALGLIPCLIPSVWKSFEYKQKSVIQITENISPNMKYEELKFYVNTFFDLMKEPNLKRLIMVKHTNAILAGLSQLCLIPISKPGTKSALESAIDEFRYDELINELKTFKTILKKLILTERHPLVIREIIFILGHKNSHKYLKIGFGELFTDLLLSSNGIQTILRVVSDLTADSSQDFRLHGLEEWSTAIHNYYNKSNTKYTNFIIPQVWELLRSNSFHQNQFRSVAVFCIHLLYKENYNDFLTYYMRPIEQSMKMNIFQKDKNASISQCIEDLHTLFYIFRNEVWSLDPKLMTSIASTIYNVYTATACGVYYLRSKLEDLVYLILVHFSNCKDHLKLIIFSQHQIDIEYDDNGENLLINYTEREHELHLENQVDLILDLMDIRKDSTFMKIMLVTLLDMFIDVVLYNEYSVMEKLFIFKAIYHLMENGDVQKSLSTDPEIVLNLITSIFKKVSDHDIIDTQVLSIALMILGFVLENINKNNIDKLDCLVDYLPKIIEVVDDERFKELVLEMQQKIKRIQNSCIKTPVKNKRTVDDVLFDARDPLLPCRSHALIELKKMIESGDQTVFAKKPAILITIQENLKNEDSYLYLSAIFTLSSLCTYYPEDILPILCEQYSLPKNCNHSPETRLKIGEVLMKTVKALNETIPVYKNLLLNTFMAGVRDDDHLVRASSLSNLADVCRLLRFNLGSIVAEIVNCADHVLRFDPANEPRRAAVLLLQMIIQGCDLELLEILADNIKEIYQMLKIQYQNDKDETIKLHAQVALENLNDIMKSLFLNKK